MDQRTKKLMTMRMALHSRDDIDYIFREKNGGKRLAGIEDCVDARIRGLHFKKQRQTNHSNQ